MSDISALQMQWQRELEQIRQEKNAADAQSKADAESLQVLEDRVKDARGFSRLKNPFIKATKVAPLRRKQKEHARAVDAVARHLREAASRTFVALGDKVAGESVYSREYHTLKAVIDQIQDTERVVSYAADKCSSASSTESQAAFINTMGIVARSESRSAVDAIDDAERAVASLQNKLRHEMPQIDGTVADNLERQNSYTFMADMIGGVMGMMASMDMANRLDDAESHLNDVSRSLRQMIGNLSERKLSILSSALTEACASDKNIEAFTLTLTEYMAPPSAPKKPYSGLAPPLY